MNTCMRIEARIDLSAIRFNMDSMHKHLRPGTWMTAVVKTDAYGHGAVPIAKEIEKLDYLWGFATATFEEAMELRDAGIEKPILILGYTFPYCYTQMAKYGIRPAVFREDTLSQLDNAAAGAGVVMPVHIAVDTGMTRIGIRPDAEGLTFVRQVLSCRNLRIEGIFTHFARADEISGEQATAEQFRRFCCFTEQIAQETGYRIPIRDCSNSASIVSHPDRNMDMVRAGITLYGLWPSSEVPHNIIPLRPALSLFSRVVYIKQVPAGTAISYGGTFTTARTTTVATICAGYGDGYPRSLSNKGYVLIRGHKVPIVGRICMDQFMTDISGFPDIQEDDPVTLIGTDGDQSITAEELGDLSGRFNYELVCDINKRVPRIYIYG